MARKFVISPTKLRIFNACEAKYRLEYIDKIGKFYHRSRAGFAFGNSLHRALDAFHNAGGAEAVPAEELTASLQELWVAKGYTGDEQEAEYRAEGVRILQEYHAAQQTALADAAEREEAPPLPKVLFTEKTLRIDLSPDVALSGRIDRVDEHHDGALEIVDFKSGRETVSEEDVAGSLALQIYQLLLKRKYPDRRVFATLVALRTGSQASHELVEAEQEELAAECLETGEVIRNKDWENTLPMVNEHCPYCDFLPHCTRFWKQQARSSQG
ncbi:MAG: PD-(D/E)XK nuclease family protein [Armatimonadota bacterium]